MNSTLIHRIGLAVSEARFEHTLSERELARLAGVSRATVHKLERGGVVRPDLAVRIAAAVIVVDVLTPATPPAPFDDEPATVPLPPPLPLVGGWAA